MKWKLSLWSLVGLWLALTQAIADPQFDKAFLATLTEAASSGNSVAQYVLGQTYATGIHVPKDMKVAKIWFYKSAIQGHESAQLNIAIMYELGKGGKQDVFQAAIWFMKAAEQGNGLAQLILGEKYRQGAGVIKDYQKALYWLHQSAEKGEVEAQFALGQMYFFGEGVSQSFEQSYAWFSVAAINGSESAYSIGDAIALMLTPVQLAKAHTLVDLLVEKYHHKNLEDKRDHGITPEELERLFE
jgi:TPR repeat protein